jgi:hypothetical protein
MMRSLLIGIALVASGTASTSYGAPPVGSECQTCIPPIAPFCNPGQTLFWDSGSQVLAVCGSNCCIDTGGQDICDTLIGCSGEDDAFAYDSVDEFATALHRMQPGKLRQLFADHGSRVEYYPPRNAVLLRGCKGSLQAVLPITEAQRTALVVAL